MDDLKKYLQHNRHSLDVESPGEEVWQNIEAEFEPSTRKVVPLWLKQVAAACIILAAGIGIYLFSFVNRTADPVVVKSPQFTPVDSTAVVKPQTQPLVAVRSTAIPKVKAVKPDALSGKQSTSAKRRRIQTNRDPVIEAFNTMETSFGAMVKLQLNKVKSTPIYAEDAGYFHLFTKQFLDLGNDEWLLKQQISKSGPTADLVDQMILVYQQKITLLRQLQFEINKMNNMAKNLDVEGIQSAPTYISL